MGFPLPNTISFLNFFHFLYKITLLWQSRGSPSRQHCLQDQNSRHIPLNSIISNEATAPLEFR